MGSRCLRLNEAHVYVLGVGELVLIERVMLNSCADPISHISSQFKNVGGHGEVELTAKMSQPWTQYTSLCRCKP
jgi:hypothetical protein